MCEGAQEKVLRGRTPAVARRAGNTAQVHRAWSPSVRADTPGGNILDQSHGDGHPLAHPAGKDSERQHLKGALAPYDKLGGLVEEGFCATDIAFMASLGILPVSLVTSPFKAATTAGRRETHSVDL